MPHFFNTLSGRVEEFVPLHNNEVRMYACGPTVYDFGHIGNFRTFVFVDLLRRYLKQHYTLRHVMNITDVDDKIIRNAAQAGVSINEYTKKYTQAFLEDAAALNIERPEILRATDNIEEMAQFIHKLVEKGFAYRTDDGSYYFRIARFPEYGKLSKKDFAGMEDGARVDVDEYEKDNARDFALWKSPKPGEHFWETSIGPGRPGWHIECSVMSMKSLGETLDIHCGGEDLVFPHHENEIAQSEALTGKTFARFWIHARFLLVEGEKMSKSLGNFYTLRDLVLMGHKPSAIRYLLSSVPYRKQLNFTFDGLKQAANSVERLRLFKNRVAAGNFHPGSSAPEIIEITVKTRQEIEAALSDDMNTARALAAVFDMVRAVNSVLDRGEFRPQDVPEVLSTLNFFDSIFAVLVDDDAAKVKKIVEWAEAEDLGAKISPTAREIAGVAGLSDAEIDKRIAEMQNARKSKDFARGDAIRNELNQMGIIVEVTKDGARWRRK
jgi:cysteinyl-tRNA synthetase